MNARPTVIAFFALPAFAVAFALLRPRPPLQGVEAGRHVYIAEGCIHCHSQFVRPGTVDEILWGKARTAEFSRRQTPPLIGNRRQGPDLLNVGLRRTREWQRAHLIDPRSLVPASRMPGYAHLFANGDSHGEAMLDYLDSLGHELQ